MCNYSKTPSRGVKEFSIELDDKLIYMGQLEAVEDVNSNSLGKRYALSISQCCFCKYLGWYVSGTKGECSILFTNDQKILKPEKDKV
jgi:hypothetical protein